MKDRGSGLHHQSVIRRARGGGPPTTSATRPTPVPRPASRGFTRGVARWSWRSRRSRERRCARADEDRAHRTRFRDRAARIRADKPHAASVSAGHEGAVLYLASDEAQYITGTTLPVAGGRWMDTTDHRRIRSRYRRAESQGGRLRRAAKVIDGLTWPNGARIAVNFTADFDAMLLRRLLNEPPMQLAKGEFGGRVGIWRLIELFDSHGSRRRSSRPAASASSTRRRCARRRRAATRSPTTCGSIACRRSPSSSATTCEDHRGDREDCGAGRSARAVSTPARCCWSRATSTSPKTRPTTGRTG